MGSPRWRERFAHAGRAWQRWTWRWARWRGVHGASARRGFAAIFAAPPCSSFLVAYRPQLRSRWLRSLRK
eukprot:1360786-Pleurochrysis_carterae.AAC.1